MEEACLTSAIGWQSRRLATPDTRRARVVGAWLSCTERSSLAQTISGHVRRGAFPLEYDFNSNIGHTCHRKSGYTLVCPEEYESLDGVGHRMATPGVCMARGVSTTSTSGRSLGRAGQVGCQRQLHFQDFHHQAWSPSTVPRRVASLVASSRSPDSRHGFSRVNASVDFSMNLLEKRAHPETNDSVVVVDQPASPSSSAGPADAIVSVCTHKHCCKRGALRVLQSLKEDAAKSDDLVIDVRCSTCLGQCKKGPAVQVSLSTGEEIVAVKVESGHDVQQLAAVAMYHS